MSRERSIELLNRAAGEEIQAILQYLYFHFVCEDRGMGKLGGLFLRVAREEMGHLSLLAERVLFLKGELVMAPAGPVERVEDVEGMLKMGMEMEFASAAFYNEAARECVEIEDFGSRQVFEKLVVDEERHGQGYENELMLLERMGASYLALLSEKGDD